ncbi:squalene synthase HpnC [Undibacterium oligocarboniphilum]|uniref:Squalene synthase HpnC n=1 Tax=Undibacterium oligocarboniphilum TaxID=666702 RepID=A0A850QQY3_9BURK|nr:squalene synthase HpnC [Undibacterium oligocarboniphilum]MBC3871234.1 squalene synthase HpnC [Undibacterium oligocarboniphilum]NVO79210.1 squalene synthase HpnC [Undibacterium oligocarboniphilum]
MSVDHYENFPVASLLLPSSLRPAVEVIYAFARSADDIADEGDALPGQRLAALAEYEAELDRIERGQHSDSALFARLAHIIRQHSLRLQSFRDLLSAFRQDVQTTRYDNFAQLQDYCSRSANPVGRIMLELYQRNTPDNIRSADAICTALQLINFWQDVAIDWQKQRVYLPQEDLRHFGVSEQQIGAQQLNPAWQQLMAFQTRRAHDLMQSGAGLARHLPGRIGWELRLVVQGGLRIIEKIDRVQGDVFRHRPRLTAVDWLLLTARAFRM